MKDILFRIDGRLIKVEYRDFFHRRKGNKTPCFTMQVDGVDPNDELTNFGFSYPINFIESGVITDSRTKEYCDEFKRNLPLYKAALDKFKRLIAFT